MQVDAIIDYLVRSRDMVQGQLGVDGGRQRLRLRRCLRAADPRPRPSWDVLIAISISSRSPNILRAIGAPRQQGLTVVASTERTGGEMAPLCNLCLHAPTCVCTPRRMGRSSFSRLSSPP